MSYVEGVVVGRIVEGMVVEREGDIARGHRKPSRVDPHVSGPVSVDPSMLCVFLNMAW